MKKIIWIPLLLFMALNSIMGCLPIAVAVIGSAGTIAAARMKMNGDVEKAKGIEVFRDTVIESLEDINKRLEDKEESEVLKSIGIIYDNQEEN
jgi:hypothetical protein